MFSGSTPVFLGFLVAMTLLPPQCRASAPYCGVYSLSAAATALGREHTFADLLTSDFVGLDGSTVRQLLHGAERMHLKSAALSGLGIIDLLVDDTPIILHVRQSRHKPFYDHWVTFLGVTAVGRATIYDSNFGVVDVELSDLLARWDGTAVIVANSNGSILMFHLMGWLGRLLVIVTIGFALLVCTRVIQRIQFRFASTILLCLVAYSYGIVFHSCTSGSVFSESVQTGLWSLHNPATVLDFGSDDLDRWKSDSDYRKNTLFVDARSSRAYSLGTIPGAVNLPIDSSYEYEASIYNTWALETQLVVFCQSKSCGYADVVASRLANYGFKNVRIYRGGLADWHARVNGNGQAYLGVYFSSNDEAVVSTLDAFGPGAKCGVEAGDKIKAIDGVAIRKPEEFIRIIKSMPSGSVVSIGLSRSGRDVSVNCELGERKRD